ncbi:MAG: Ig-like domain-containing protein [Lachnospiraceae bacterium]|nr:Ig-like domain-containing protein [Lachnospiraceae bacterium]
MKNNLRLRQVKRLLSVFVMACFLVALIPTTTVQAKTWTKKTVKEEIKKQKKKLKEAEKKLESQKKKKEKETKDCIGVLGATVISSDPLVIYYEGLFGMNKGYYWIESGTQNFSTILGTGTLKKTGGYRTYNGITCVACKGVKVTTDVSKYEKKVKDIKSKIEGLESALKCSVSFKEGILCEDYDYDNELIYDYESNMTRLSDINTPGVIFAKIGETVEAGKYVTWDYDKYTKLKWSSSDSSVFTVNSKGKITPVGEGIATLTVKASISGAKAKTTVYVANFFDFTDESGKTLERANSETNWIEYTPDGVPIYYNASLQRGKTMTICPSFESKIANPSVKYYSSDEEIATVNENGIITATSFDSSIDEEVYIYAETEYLKMAIRIYVYKTDDDDYSYSNYEEYTEDMDDEWY